MAELKSFTVYAVVNVSVAISIKAENLLDAVEESKQLRETDFVKILGNYLDGSMRIQGVNDESVNLEK